MTVVRNEMDRGASDTNNVMVQTMLRSGFDWHGYGRSTIGSPSDVEDAPSRAACVLQQALPSLQRVL